MRGFVQRTGTALIAATVIAACGSSNSGTGNNPAQTIAKDPVKSGDAQLTTVGATATDSLRVLVKEDGNPLAGATVTWATSGTAAAVSPLTSQTDVAGLAATQWTVSHTAGQQTATATLAGAGGSPVTFHATANPGAATAFTQVSGTGQTSFVTTAFGQPLLVKLADQFGNGIPAVSVAWAVQSGSITLSAPNSITNAQGQASITATSGAVAGAGVVRATTAAVPATNLDFALTVAAFPTTAAVHTNGISYVSTRNATSDPAVDTIGVGGTVTWSGLGIGAHLVQSTGNPSFTTQTVDAATYQFTFNTVGTYQYDCSVHGTAMTGTVVVK